MEGMWRPNFWGRFGKVETFTFYISKWEVPARGLEFFYVVGDFEYSKIKS